jgi:hypothetical protein
MLPSFNLCQHTAFTYVCYYLIHTCPTSPGKVKKKVFFTFLHGFGLTSNEALNCRLCAAVRMVRGRFGPRRPSRWCRPPVSTTKSSARPAHNHRNLNYSVTSLFSPQSHRRGLHTYSHRNLTYTRTSLLAPLIYFRTSMSPTQSHRRGLHTAIEILVTLQQECFYRSHRTFWE